MQIAKETLERWKTLHSPGDAGKMVSMYGEGGYPEMFHRALRLGRCSDDTYKTMKKFFDKKAKLLKACL